MSKSFTVILSSLKMAIATFMSRILGLVREQVMAAMFGASGLTDAYLVAFRIPNLLRDLFAEGAFSSAFVPTFVEANNEDHQKGRQLLWALFVLLFLMTGFFSLLIFYFAPEIISVFAPSFKADPAKLDTTITLTRMMAPFLVFVSLAALFMGALNSLKIFFIPALAPAFFNVVMIASMLILPELKVCYAYEVDGKEYDCAYPGLDLSKAVPKYKVMRPFKDDFQKSNEYTPELTEYISFIEESLGITVGIIAYGPERSQIHFRKEYF